MPRPFPNLQPDKDGLVEVTILENPMPRAVSIVDWGANNRPMLEGTYKAADAAAQHHVLRSPPSVVDAQRASLPELENFVIETMSAWEATMADLLARPVTAAQRGAHAQALTVQAGMRLAALVAALQPAKVRQLAASYQAAQLKLPEPAQLATLEGELQRRALVAGINQAGIALADQVLALCAAGGEPQAIPEQIMRTFAEAADVFASWFGGLADGVVGAAPSTAQKALSGGQHAILGQVIQLLATLQGTPEGASMDISQLSAAQPDAFLQAFTTAFKAATPTTRAQVTAVLRDAWGETGADQFESAAILRQLSSLKPLTLLNLFGQALAGLDVEGAGKSGPGVVSSLKEAGSFVDPLGAVLAAELKAHPEGQLAMAVKTAVANSVSEALKQAVVALRQGGQLETQPGTRQGLHSLTPELPGKRS